MKKHILTFLAAILLIVSIMGCGMSDENNPLGVLGGSSSGYGNSDGADYSSSGLLGSWIRWTGTDSYEIITFYGDNSAEGCYVVNGNSSCTSFTYWVEGDLLTFSTMISYRYEIKGNILYLYSPNDGSLLFTLTRET